MSRHLSTSKLWASTGVNTSVAGCYERWKTYSPSKKTPETKSKTEMPLDLPYLLDAYTAWD